MPNLVESSVNNIHLLEHDVVQCRHNLDDTNLFDDQHLLRIFKTHPEEYMQIYTMGDDHGNLQDFRLGQRDNVTSEALLKAVKEGRLWFNIMGLDYFHPEYKKVLDQLFDELEAQNPEFKTFERSATLLVSSPKAKVYYHADGPPNILCHIRGRKRVSLYPLTEQFASPLEIEKIFTRESNDDLTYDLSFDDSATDYILNEGEMIAWPQNMPHRVDNLDSFCVSLSAEYYSDLSIKKRDTYLANHYLRKWLKLPLYSTTLDGAWPKLKRVLYHLCERLPFQQVEEAEERFEFSLAEKLK